MHGVPVLLNPATYRAGAVRLCPQSPRRSRNPALCWQLPGLPDPETGVNVDTAAGAQLRLLNKPQLQNGPGE